MLAAAAAKVPKAAQCKAGKTTYNSFTVTGFPTKGLNDCYSFFALDTKKMPVFRSADGLKAFYRTTSDGTPGSFWELVQRDVHGDLLELCVGDDGKHPTQIPEGSAWACVAGTENAKVKDVTTPVGITCAACKAKSCV
jgi:hypothetical protein